MYIKGFKMNFHWKDPDCLCSVVVTYYACGSADCKFESSVPQNLFCSLACAKSLSVTLLYEKRGLQKMNGSPFTCKANGPLCKNWKLGVMVL